MGYIAPISHAERMKLEGSAEATEVVAEVVAEVVEEAPATEEVVEAPKKKSTKK